MSTTSKERKIKVNTQLLKEEVHYQSIKCIKNWRLCDEKEKEYWVNRFIKLNHYIIDKEVEKNIFLIEGTILEKQDLISCGYEGLLVTMKLFDLDNKKIFRSYMQTKVQYHIRKCINDNRSSFKITIFEKEKINRMHRLIDKHNLTYKCEQEEFLMKKLHISETQLNEMKKFEETCVYNQISLDAVFDNLKEDEFIDIKQRFIDREMNQSLEEEVISKCFVEYITEEARELLSQTLKWKVFIRIMGLEGHSSDKLCNIANSINTSQSYASAASQSAIRKVRYRAEAGEIINWYKEDE